MDFVKDFCQQFKDESKAAKDKQKDEFPKIDPKSLSNAPMVYKRPKRALTPYLLFAAEQRKELPGMRVCEQMK